MMDATGLWIAVRRVGLFTLFGAIPLALLVGVMAGATLTHVRAGNVHAIDFHTFWIAARTFVAGGNPYPRAASLSVWTPLRQQAFVYPAPAVGVLAPFAYLPYSIAVMVFVPLLACSIVVALWLLGVRDWRCYGAVVGWPAVLTAISLGTLSPLLLLGVAAAWRWRERRVVVGFAVAAVVLAKLFMWPLLIWLWFSGRRRAALIGVAGAAAATAAAWGWIGFAGFTSYPGVLHRLSLTEGPHSYAPLWLVGSSSIFWIAGLLGGAIVAVVARRHREPLSFAVAIVVALLLTPILWLHYLALLAAVVAVLKPTFGVTWLLPLAAWVTAQQGSFYGGNWRTVLIGLLVLATLASALEVVQNQWRGNERLAIPSRSSEPA